MVVIKSIFCKPSRQRQSRRLERTLVSDLPPRGGLGLATAVDTRAGDIQESEQRLPEKRLLIHLIHLNYSFAEHIFLRGLFCRPHGESHGECGPCSHGVWRGRY